jgi:hypothetical protein
MPYYAIHQNIDQAPPAEWFVTHSVGGLRGGVYFVPKCWTDNGVALNFNATLVGDHRLRGHRLLFEFFQLAASLEVKISARVLINDGAQFALVGQNTLFGELQRLAVELGVPQPQAVLGELTRTCAVWREPRAVFQRDDVVGMADWMRNFLINPPQNFHKFVEGALPILHGAYPPQ